jgi:hypothetical protein
MIFQSTIPLYQWYSVYLATVEVALGAVLHGARIPLTGYILSLHQAFCLTRAVRHDGRIFTPLSVSATVAILKTLSPMGKKITPMMAILVQGFLFNMGILCLGNSMAGHMLGAVLLSLWGFIQPMLFAYVIFGQDLLAGLSILEQLTNQYLPGFSLLMVFGGIVCFKAILAIATVLLANSSLAIEPWVQERLVNKRDILNGHLSQTRRSILYALSKDLTSFWFMFSYATLMLLCWWRQDPLTQSFLTMMMYLGQSILLFMVLRLINPQKLTPYLERMGLCNISANLRATFLMYSNHDKER